MLWPLVQHLWRHVSGSGCKEHIVWHCVQRWPALWAGDLAFRWKKTRVWMKTTSSELRMFFFCNGQSTSSRSCCNTAIKIVFHSAFNLYITKATIVFFPLSLTCWQFSWTKKKEKKKKITQGQTIYLLSFLPLPLFPNTLRVFGLLWKTILIIWECGSFGSHCVYFVLCSFPSQGCLDVGLVVLFSEEGETSVSYYPSPLPHTHSNLWN